MKKLSIDELVEQYADYCYRVAYVYCKEHEAAEEIVQDVLMSYYSAQQRFNGESTLKTYLTKITVHKSYDYLRTRKRKFLFFKAKIDEEKHFDPSYLHLQAEKNGEVLQAVLDLDEKYREIIVLHYYEEMTLVEISDVLSLNINTVKSRHSRAKKQLQDQLKEVYFDEEF